MKNRKGRATNETNGDLGTLERTEATATVGWVNIHKRLPEPSQPCIFCIPLSGNPEHMIIGYIPEEYCEGETVGEIFDLSGSVTGFEISSVTYWMPAPSVS